MLNMWHHSARFWNCWHPCCQIWVIFTHLKLWIASARHNFKWVTISIAKNNLVVKEIIRRERGLYFTSQLGDSFYILHKSCHSDTFQHVLTRHMNVMYSATVFVLLCLIIGVTWSSPSSPSTLSGDSSSSSSSLQLLRLTLMLSASESLKILS